MHIRLDLLLFVESGEVGDTRQNHINVDYQMRKRGGNDATAWKMVKLRPDFFKGDGRVLAEVENFETADFPSHPARTETPPTPYETIAATSANAAAECNGTKCPLAVAEPASDKQDSSRHHAMLDAIEKVLHQDFAVRAK